MRLPHFTAGTLLDFSFSTRSRCKFAVKSLENGLNTRWRARGSRRGVPRQQGGVRGMAATLSFFAAALQKKIKNINNTQWPRGEANSWLLGVSGSIWWWGIGLAVGPVGCTPGELSACCPFLRGARKRSLGCWSILKPYKHTLCGD